MGLKLAGFDCGHAYEEGWYFQSPRMWVRCVLLRELSSTSYAVRKWWQIGRLFRWQKHIPSSPGAEFLLFLSKVPLRFPAMPDELSKSTMRRGLRWHSWMDYPWWQEEVVCTVVREGVWEACEGLWLEEGGLHLGVLTTGELCKRPGVPAEGLLLSSCTLHHKHLLRIPACFVVGPYRCNKLFRTADRIDVLIVSLSLNLPRNTYSHYCPFITSSNVIKASIRRSSRQWFDTKLSAIDATKIMFETKYVWQAC